jgi:hypothetical protein
VRKWAGEDLQGSKRLNAWENYKREKASSAERIRLFSSGFENLPTLVTPFDYAQGDADSFFVRSERMTVSLSPAFGGVNPVEDYYEPATTLTGLTQLLDFDIHTLLPVAFQSFLP